MPKGLNLKNFGRRKSSANALDFEEGALPSPSAQSSFRVLERTEKKSTPYGVDNKTTARPFNSPLHALRGKSADDLGLGPNRAVNKATRNQSIWPLTAARGSGGTTNSGSSGYYESSGASARHSSTSTLPSSLDQDRSPEDEELFPQPRNSTTMGMYHNGAINTDDLPPPPPSFTSRAARAFSFANKSGRPSSKDVPDVPPMPPPHAHGAYGNPASSQSPQRERAMTTSSYASTAVPSKTELTLGNPDFGNDDFGNMFDSLKRESTAPPPVGTFHRTESEPMYPPRTLSRNALTPSPNPLKLSRDDSNSPYSFDDGSSNDGLVSNSALSSPTFADGGTNRAAVGNGITQAFLGNSKSGYSRVPERYTSPGPENELMLADPISSFMADDSREKEHAYPNRQTQVDDGDRWTRKGELRDGPPPPRLSSLGSPNRLAPSSKGKQPVSNPSSSPAGATSPSSAGESAVDSNTTTPRATRNLNTPSQNGLFDSSPAGPASRAVRPGASHQRTESGTIKMMTKAQFNALKRQDQSSADQSEEEGLSSDEYDDEDDVERARKMASQRQKQEANMSVYRQQMKKVTGGGPTDLPSSAASTVRPSNDRASTAPSIVTSGGLHFGGIGGTPPESTHRGKQGEDDDDDVPLGVLQAHGFPSSTRPPTRTGENDLAYQRRTSVAGSAVVGGGAGQGNLPPFARRLPVDPYFGAGLVNHSTRESLALNNSSAASVMGMPPSAPPQMFNPPMHQASPMGHPGGLVGVIAGEERARAARRGSPNATAMMGGNMPLPANMNMPHMPRTMSMGNMMPPQVYNPSGAPPMPPMPMGMGMGMGMPGMMPMQMPPQDAGQQQIQQFMQMQMQLMQNMLNMQQAQMGQAGPQTPQAQMQQQQTGDYLGVNFGSPGRPMSIASQATNQQYMQQPAPAQNRSMTMMNPPSGWGSATNPSGPRPNSAMPLGGGYAPSVQGLNISGGGPAQGYTPSIAPSERSNVGMPSRYRPVAQNGESTRTYSMTSNFTLQPFQHQQTAPNVPGTPFNSTQIQTPKSTIRVLDKPKGAAKVTSRTLDDDEDDGWADMKKKRDEKKKSKWSLRKEKNASNNTHEPALSDLYTSLD